MTVLKPMSKGERLELAKLVRLRGKVAKDDIDQRAARLLADVEAQLAARYPANHEAWAEITERAKKSIAAADAEIAHRCRALGIPENFRPGIALSWYSRGENAMRERRAELRKVAQTELAARSKAAKVEIDRHAAQLLTQLAAGALESSESRAFLDAMPSIDELMPRLTLPELGAPLADSDECH